MWILPKQLHSWNGAQDMGALDLASKESLEKDCELSHIVSLRGMLKPISSVRWKKDSWMSHLFGRMLKPSLAKNFTDWWTSCLRDTLANHSPQQENGGGESDPRHLWPFIQRSIAVIRPRFCFFENVRGHLTLGFKNVCHDLGELGYEVVAGLFTAAECGAEHERERLYILAYSNNQGLQGGVQLDSIVKKTDGKPSNIMGGYSFGTPLQYNNRAWPSESMFCRVVNAATNRVERLRLCGNGVVPQTAELAFKTLYAELHKDTI